MSNPQGRQIALLDVLRAFSIAAVLATHFACVPSLDYSGSLGSVLFGLARNGAYGVNVFFVISGFLITRMIDGREGTLFAPDLRRFYVRRLARIVPMLLLSVSIGLLVLHFGKDFSEGYALTFRDPRAQFDRLFWVSVAFFFFNLLRIHAEPVSPYFGMNWDVLWSLAVEEQFYLGYPWLLRNIKTLRRLVVILLLIVASGPAYRTYAFYTRPQSFLFAFTSSLGAFDQLALGALGYLTYRRVRTTRFYWLLGPLCAILGAAVAGYAYFKTWPGDPFDRIYAPTLLGFGIATLLAGALDNRFFDLPVFAPLRGMGRLSYEAYLLHSFVLYALWPIWRKPLPVAAVMGGFIVSVLILSDVVQRWFAEPARAFISSTLLKKDDRPRVVAQRAVEHLPRGSEPSE